MGSRRTEAFNEATRACLPRLYRYASRLCPSRDAAADAVQDAVLRAIERHDLYDPSRPILPWLMTLVRHAVVDRSRAFDPFRRAGELSEINDLPVARGPDPARDAATTQAGDRLVAALGRLPLEQRSTVILFYLEGMTIDEIAQVESVAAGTIKSRLHRAREALAAMLGTEFDGGSLWN